MLPPPITMLILAPASFVSTFLDTISSLKISKCSKPKKLNVISDGSVTSISATMAALSSFYTRNTESDTAKHNPQHKYIHPASDTPRLRNQGYLNLVRNTNLNRCSIIEGVLLTHITDFFFFLNTQNNAY